MKRLAKYLDGFASSFHRRAQRCSAKRYVQGLLSDAKRKNMEGMLRRLAEPGDYRAKGRARAEAEFSVARMTERTLAVYESAAR